MFVEHVGERTVFGDGEAVMPWDALVTIAATRPQCLAALQRFTWIAMTDVPAANRALREAHTVIGVMAEIGPFVDRTLLRLRVRGHIEEAPCVLAKAAPASGATADDLRSNDVFDVLHDDPRWQALIAKL